MPRIFLLSVCLAAATAGAQAPAPAPAAPVAEPVVAEAAPLAETETKLTFDERLGAGGVDIREQAKIELLDIDSLRAVVRPQGRERDPASLAHRLHRARAGAEQRHPHRRAGAAELRRRDLRRQGRVRSGLADDDSVPQCQAVA